MIASMLASVWACVLNSFSFVGEVSYGILASFGLMNFDKMMNILDFAQKGFKNLGFEQIADWLKRYYDIRARAAALEGEAANMAGSKLEFYLLLPVRTRAKYTVIVASLIVLSPAILLYFIVVWPCIHLWKLLFWWKIYLEDDSEEDILAKIEAAIWATWMVFSAASYIGLPWSTGYTTSICCCSSIIMDSIMDVSS